MSRKIIISLFVVAMLMSMVAVASASDPVASGCFIQAPTASYDTGTYTVNEGTAFNISVDCNSVSNVYGFEFGTSLSAVSQTNSVPDLSVDTPVDPNTFYALGSTSGNSWAGDVNHYLVQNTMDLLAISHVTPYEVTASTFNMASFPVTASKGLLTDGNATISFLNSTVKLSDIYGAPITGLQASPNASLVIKDIPLTLLSGTLAIQSDGAMTSLQSVVVNLAPDAGSDGTGSSDPVELTTFTQPTSTSEAEVDIGNLEFYSDAKANLAADISVSMESHLACATTKYALEDGIGTIDAQIDPITLKAGDVIATDGTGKISLADATRIGSQFGLSNGDGGFDHVADVNKDDTVNIYDLVAFGRNYGSVEAYCDGTTI